MADRHVLKVEEFVNTPLSFLVGVPRKDFDSLALLREKGPLLRGTSPSGFKINLWYGYTGIRDVVVSNILKDGYDVTVNQGLAPYNKKILSAKDIAEPYAIKPYDTLLNNLTRKKTIIEPAYDNGIVNVAESKREGTIQFYILD